MPQVDPIIPLLGNRLTIWIVAQLHLNFAAFILGAYLLNNLGVS